MEGLRSGRLKVEKERSTMVEDDPQFDDGDDQKKVDGEVAISVGRVLRSGVMGKKRGLVSDDVEEEVKEENAGIGSGRVLRSRNVVSDDQEGREESVARVLRSRNVVGGDEVEKRKRQRLVSNSEDGVVDDEKKGNCKATSVVRVLRSRTVVNGDCDKTEIGRVKVESDGGEAGLDDVKIESDSDKVQSASEDVEAAAKFGNGGGVDEHKVKETEVTGERPDACRVLGSRDVVNGDCDKAEIGGDMVMSDSGRELVIYAGKTESNGDIVASVSNDMEATTELGNRTRLVGNGGSVDKKKVKETKVSRKIPAASRVLRSRTKLDAGCTVESNSALVESNSALVIYSGPCDEYQKNASDVINQGEDQLVTKVTKKLKGKRRRKPKIEKEKSRRPCNRPRKLEDNCSTYLKRKRSKKELDVKVSSDSSLTERVKRLKGSECEDSHVHKKPKQERSIDGQKQESKSKDGLRERKQAVSEKIIKMVLDAGWKIERRPRNGREYMDAVYVCPAGKTHWSVTKAYNALKVGCENGDEMACKSGFIFAPIPPEELILLRRVVGDKKKGKVGVKGKNNTKKKAKDADTSDEHIKERKKKKPGKSLKGKDRLFEKDASTSTGCKGKLQLFQCHKRQKSQSERRCVLLVRNSENKNSGTDGYIPYDGKRTILAWMIDLGILSLNSKLKYMHPGKRRPLLEGVIARDGIHCGCCDEIVSLWAFVTHTKCDYSVPLRYILTDSGTSLFQCLLNSWNKQAGSEHLGTHIIEVSEEDPNDDTCGICGDGGNLICCDGCPSTFHESCLDIKKFPSGDWHCVYCSCKFCGMFDDIVSGRDGSEDVAASVLLTCHLCEEKYHQCCIKEKDVVNGDSCSPSFCGKNCQELFEKLESLIGARHEVEEGFFLTLLRRFDLGDTPQKGDCNSKLIECNAKLAVAFLVMDECFLPMVDHRSGVNLIHNILYNRGSNFNRLNYGNFFTAILERGDEIISAATVRIHGNCLAEMPFIGTRYVYRRQGMCRRLLNAIESALCSLKVERLIIPAISELNETWTSVFGFKSLEESSKQIMKNMNILVFPGVDILQKPLLNQSTETQESPVKGLSSAGHETLNDKVCNSDECRLARSDHSDAETSLPCGHEGNNELAAVQSYKENITSVSHDYQEDKRNTIPITSHSVCDVLDPTKLMNGYQNSTNEGTLLLVREQNQQALLCDTSEGFLAGTDIKATASTKHKANGELIAVKSKTVLHCGVSNGDVDDENNTTAIHTGSMSDACDQTEDSQPVSGVSHDKEIELATEHNQDSISIAERSSDFHTEGGVHSGIDVTCSLVESTENCDRRSIIKDGIIEPLGPDEGYFHPSTADNATQLQNGFSVDEAKVSGENNVGTNADMTSQISHDARDQKHPEFQHLQVEECIFRPDQKMVETCEVENNCSCIQEATTVTEGVISESVTCSDYRILTETSTLANDESHQPPLLSRENGDKAVPFAAALLASLATDNTHKFVSTPADNNSHLSCGANIESNGTSVAPNADFTSNGDHMNTNQNLTAI